VNSYSKFTRKLTFENFYQARDPESITLSMWWTTDDTILKNFLKAALQVKEPGEGEGTLEIYVKHAWVAIWDKAVSKSARSKETIVLDEDLADYVLEDMRHFFSEKNATWYKTAGIPYRRGYLMHGPPGCGKTTFAQVLAGELGLDICLVNLSGRKKYVGCNMKCVCHM
jgi:chaperone BCS1